MRKLKFLIFVLLLTFAISCGQQKRYITYKVKADETIQDIANKLQIETKDLLRLNPDVGEKPVENTIIVIPNPSLKKTDTTTDNAINNATEEEKKINNTNYIDENNTDDDIVKPIDSITKKVVSITYDTHTIQKGETVYSLTKKYSISKGELMTLNPDFPQIKDNLLSIGQVLKVKKIETVQTIKIPNPTISLKEELKKFVTHEVQPKETVYSITRFYNISKEELMALNPHLPDLKNNLLSIGDVLKIKSIKEKADTDTNKIYIDSINIDKPIKLAMLLPFKAKEYDTIQPKDIFEGEGSLLPNMVTDFYMGGEIAIDSLKQQGIDIQVVVLDTGNRGENVPEILAKNTLDDVDVVIGPFYSDKAELVAKEINAPIIFPHFSKKQTEFSSSKLVKTAPDTNDYALELTSFLKSKYNNETIFVVGDNKPTSNLLVSNIVSNLKQNDSIKEITVLKPEKGYIKKERFTDKMKPKTHCWVIMTSSDNVVVADALNSMMVLPDEVTGQVFAVSKNRAYDKIGNNKLARMEFTYVTNDFIDENDNATKVFNKKYDTKNYTTPSEYAIRGFDITYDILMRLASGESLSKTFKEGTSIRIGNKFVYHKKIFGSTSNKGLFIVKYNKDLSLSRIK